MKAALVPRMLGVSAAVVVAAGLIAVGIYAAGRLRGAKTPHCPDCNIILISIDSLRADHLSCYGYPRRTSPAIDQFAKQAITFNWAITQAPSTTPAHASMLTALLPSQHGAFFTRKSAISPDVPTLAELLKQAGFRTASFNGGGQVGSPFGFDRGFETFESYAGHDYENEDFIDRVAAGMAWIKQDPQRPFFLFLHTYEVHHPYAPGNDFLPEPEARSNLPAAVTAELLRRINSGKLQISAADRQHILDSYDGEIRSMDRAFGLLIAELTKAGLLDKTMIIFTSDHGEEFGEHGKLGWHSHTLFDELLRVPLLVRFPNQAFAGAVLPEQVRSIDIPPTVLEFLQVEIPPHFQGKSLLQLLSGSREFPEHAFSQRDSKSSKVPTSVRTADWKVYKRALYNLRQDPTEQVDVAKQNPGKDLELRRLISAVLAEKPIESSPASTLDAEALEQLKTLGYVN